MRCGRATFHFHQAIAADPKLAKPMGFWPSWMRAKGKWTEVSGGTSKKAIAWIPVDSPFAFYFDASRNYNLANFTAAEK